MEARMSSKSATPTKSGDLVEDVDRLSMKMDAVGDELRRLIDSDCRTEAEVIALLKQRVASALADYRARFNFGSIVRPNSNPSHFDLPDEDNNRLGKQAWEDGEERTVARLVAEYRQTAAQETIGPPASERAVKIAALTKEHGQLEQAVEVAICACEAAGIETRWRRGNAKLEIVLGCPEGSPLSSAAVAKAERLLSLRDRVQSEMNSLTGRRVGLLADGTRFPGALDRLKTAKHALEAFDLEWSEHEREDPDLDAARQDVVADLETAQQQLATLDQEIRLLRPKYAAVVELGNRIESHRDQDRARRAATPVPHRPMARPLAASAKIHGRPLGTRDGLE